VKAVAMFTGKSMSPLTLLGSAILLLLAACDNFRLPALPARSGGESTAVAAATPPKTAKPNRAAGRPAAYDRVMASHSFDAIRRGLRRLVVAQETYYAENGIYTEDLTRLGVTPEGGTAMRFLWLTRTGWAASGTHPDVPGRDCVIYVGRDHGPPTTLHDVRSGREGTPVCDALPGSRRPPAGSAATTQPPLQPAAQPAPAVPDTGSALDAVEPTIQMRVDLRNLVRSQDTYFGNQGVYSRRTEPFALQYLWHRGVKITILSANDQSWSARATHASRPGKSCVIWLGPVPQRPTTETQKRTVEEPAVPVCDD
jgi:hypothetical protein